jgi:hypothetical protein
VKSWFSAATGHVVHPGLQLCAVEIGAFFFSNRRGYRLYSFARVLIFRLAWRETSLISLLATGRCVAPIWPPHRAAARSVAAKAAAQAAGNSPLECD